jgi:predicted nucleotidyltransferase
MPGHLSSAKQHRQRAEQSVAMAKAATSNKMRAHHYAAAAEHYRKLAEGEAKSAARPDGVLSNRLHALVQLSRPLSRFPQDFGKSVWHPSDAH